MVFTELLRHSLLCNAMALRSRPRQRGIMADHEQRNVDDDMAAMTTLLCRSIRERVGAAAEEVLALVRDAVGESALPALVKERLAVAAEHICELVHAAVTRYEERIRRQERLFDLVYQPQPKLHRTEPSGVTRDDHRGSASGPPPAGDPVALETDPSPGQLEEKPGECAVTAPRGRGRPKKKKIMMEEQDEVQEVEENDEVEIEEEEDEEEEDDEWTPGHPSTNPARGRGRQKTKKKKMEVGVEEERRLVRERHSFAPVSRACLLCHASFPGLGLLLQHAAEPCAPSVCGVCGERVGPGDALARHMHAHREALRRCEACGRSFRSFLALEHHQRCHTGERPYPCPVCGKAFSQRGNMLAHQRRHGGDKPFRCGVCDKAFHYKVCLERHGRTHDHGAYACPACAQVFSTEYDLKQHQRSHRPPDGRATAVRRPREAEPAHRCKVCGDAFRRVKLFMEHAQTHLVDQGSGCCPFCGAWCPSGDDLRAHFKTHVVSAHICDVCGKGFSSGCALTKHLVVHTGERPFACDVCGKAFSQPGGLKMHRVVHTGERPFVCDVCGKTFQQKHILCRHVRFHNKERPYLCQVCGKSFVQSVDLWRHKLTHTGEQPYGCSQCGRRFQARRCLNLHMKKHQQERPPDGGEDLP